MNTKSDSIVRLARLIIAIAAADIGNGAPDGHVYAAMMGTETLDSYMRLVHAAEEIGTLTRAPGRPLLVLTAKGKDLLERFKAALA